MQNITQALIEYINEHNFDYGRNPAKSVSEFLYIAYRDLENSEIEEIEKGFASLDKYSEKKSLEEAEELFAIVCDLCIAYEQRAFTDGLHLGAQLMIELQEGLDSTKR